jgi:predicted RND superfamily exporter protein
MAAVSDDLDQMPVVRDLADFDTNSGNALERLVFNNRLAMIVFCAVVTVVLGFIAVTRFELNASFEKTLPQSQEYIQNYLKYQKDLRGLGNALRVVVENTDGDIFDPRYLQALKEINDELFLTPGVDRAWVKSLWTPAVRWTEVTEEGFRGGPVMPDSYDGSPATVEQLRQNIARSGIVGSLVANNFKSSASTTAACRECWTRRSATSTSSRRPSTPRSSRRASRPTSRCTPSASPSWWAT